VVSALDSRCICGEMRRRREKLFFRTEISREAVMQDAFVGSWAQDSHLSSAMLESLRDLNHQFLDLAAARPDWGTGYVAPLTEAQRAAAAGCPYALFDLRFEDEGYWRLRLRHSTSWRVADDLSMDDAIASFVRLALFYAWHVAWSASLKAQLLLGMNGNTAAAFRTITVNQIPALAATEAVHLSARWTGCPAYWRSLSAAASRSDAAALRRVQLYGLQLAAAARLPDS
jgi:hypothetical protein